MSRFSKAAVASWANRRIDMLEEEFHFDRQNGYSQVAEKDAAANRAYGEWNALLNLIEEFNLGGK